MKGDIIMLLNGDDGSRKRGLRQLSAIGDVAGNGFPKLLNVAGVLMMSTLVSCVQRFSIHDLLLVVVFLHVGTGRCGNRLTSQGVSCCFSSSACICSLLGILA